MTGALAGGVAALLVWTLFFGGGSNDLSIAWLGTATVLAAALAIAAALLGVLPWPEPDRAGIAFVVLAGLFVLWNGASISWSLDPDRSWAYTNRGLVYFAFACLGLFVGAVVPRAPRAVGAALAVLLAGVLGWALLGKVVPSLFPDGGRLARLRSPIGYWNALALLADAAVALGLWLAARREHRPAARVAGVVLLYAAVVSVLLAYSRAGVLVAIAVVAMWLALRPERLESLAACGLAAAAGGAMAGWAVTRPGIAHDAQPYSARVHDGAIFGVVFVVGAVIVVVAAASLLRANAETPLAPELRSQLVRVSLIGVVVLAALLFVGSTIKAGGPGAWLDARVHEFTSQASVSETPGRVKSFSSNHRWAWWKESWSSFLDHPLEGTGAGSFVLVHRPRYDDWSLPKGKLDPGEDHAAAARREVEEETGLRCILEEPLPSSRYRDRRGRLKVVRYWLMHPVGEARTPSAYATGEVDQVVWRTVDDAVALTTYERDRNLIHAAAALVRART